MNLDDWDSVDIGQRFELSRLEEQCRWIVVGWTDDVGITARSSIALQEKPGERERWSIFDRMGTSRYVEPSKRKHQGEPVISGRSSAVVAVKKLGWWIKAGEGGCVIAYTQATRNVPARYYVQFENGQDRWCSEDDIAPAGLPVSAAVVDRALEIVERKGLFRTTIPPRSEWPEPKREGTPYSSPPRTDKAVLAIAAHLWLEAVAQARAESLSLTRRRLDLIPDLEDVITLSDAAFIRAKYAEMIASPAYGRGPAMDALEDLKAITALPMDERVRASAAFVAARLAQS